LGLPAKGGAVNFKGRGGENVITAHLAMSAALDGYKVLIWWTRQPRVHVVHLRRTVGDEWPAISTDGTSLRKHHALKPAPAGPRRIALYDTLSQAMDVTAADVTENRWPNMPILSGPQRSCTGPISIRSGAWPPWLEVMGCLGDALAEDGVLDE
jgi:chromosome partitioning protein